MPNFCIRPFQYLYGVLLQMLEQGSAHGMDDALGLTGRPAAVHDEQRVVERDLSSLCR